MQEETPLLSLPPSFRAGVVLRTQKTGHPSGFSISPAAAFSPRESALAGRVFSANLGVPPDRVRLLRQVHGTEIVERHLREDAATRPAADAHWTRARGLVLLVFVADCCPVMFVDPVSGITALAHAGWRGTLGGIVPALFETIISAGADPATLRCWVGPCAGAARYEVGPEVAERFREYPQAIGAPNGTEGPVTLDIRAVLHAQLLRCGLGPGRIELSRGDTIGESRYHSHRRDRIRAGRMAAYVTGAVSDRR